jgi:hypothetical protein
MYWYSHSYLKETHNTVKYIELRLIKIILIDDTIRKILNIVLKIERD